MASKDYPEFSLDSFKLVNFILRHWKLFTLTALAAFIISALVSYTLTPRFKSTVVLYPSSDIESPSYAIFEQGSNVVGFGDEEATEKIFQMLHSDMIKEHLIEKYRLLDHYNIDEGTKYPYTLLDNSLKKNISFSKTRFMSVRIDVLDTDPEIAAAMANDIASLVDKSFNAMLQEAGIKQLHALEYQLREQQIQVRAIEDSIKNISGTIVSGYHSTDGRGGISVTPYSPEMMRFLGMHEQALDDLGIINQKYSEARMSAEGELSYTLIVNRAKVAEKKALPRRSVICLASTASALLFLLFLLMLIEGFSASLRREEQKKFNE